MGSDKGNVSYHPALLPARTPVGSIINPAPVAAADFTKFRLFMVLVLEVYGYALSGKIVPWQINGNISYLFLFIPDSFKIISGFFNPG